METTWTLRRHLEAILDIERRSFDDPWPEDKFVSTLRRNGVVGLSAFAGNEETGPLVAYCIYSLDKGHITILNLAVHPQHRRNKIATRLVAKIKEKLSKGRRIRIVSTVSEANLAAQLFLRSEGFKCDAILPRHYEHEDAYRFNYVLPVTTKQGIKELA